MLRASLCALVVLAAGLGGCHKNADPPPVHPQEGEAPPLPPSSGTPVGYLIDNAPTLKLRDDQLVKLKDIDRSLSAKDDELDTQIRMIEKPAEDPEVPKGAPPPRSTPRACWAMSCAGWAATMKRGCGLSWPVGARSG